MPRALSPHKALDILVGYRSPVHVIVNDNSPFDPPRAHAVEDIVDVFERFGLYNRLHLASGREFKALLQIKPCSDDRSADRGGGG